jgi:hypothetical protein
MLDTFCKCERTKSLGFKTNARKIFTLFCATGKLWKSFKVEVPIDDKEIGSTIGNQFIYYELVPSNHIIETDGENHQKL